MSKKEIRIGKLQFGDRFYYEQNKNRGGYVVRNSEIAGLVVVEQDDGQVSYEEQDLVVYTNDSLGE